MNPVVHFEMPYENSNRMADFYAKAFGWKPQKLGPEMGNYVVSEHGSRCSAIFEALSVAAKASR